MFILQQSCVKHSYLFTTTLSMIFVHRLDGCNLTEGNYSSLLSALTSHPSCLTGKHLECDELELLLSTVFYENCKVEELR